MIPFRLMSKYALDENERYNSGMLLPNPTCHGWDMDNASAVDPPISKISGDVVLSSNVLRSLKAVDDITKAIARDNMTDTVTGESHQLWLWW